jgi:GntR family transcriptional regulator, transcriptional repressor for pyruvate dehydrogenase complex
VRLQIEEAIRRGDFGPGERLPSERELVETFGVSRVSVREAIRSLEALGLVRVQQGRGAFVGDRRSGLGEPMARWLQLHRDEVLELHLVRGALDELAAQSAAARHDEAAIAAIAAVHERLAAAVEAGVPIDELILVDIDFHTAIAEASGNRLLYDLMHDLHTYLAESRKFVLSTASRPRQSVAEHAEILAAIVAGDPELAVQATARHVAAIRELVVSGLASTPRPDH